MFSGLANQVSGWVANKQGKPAEGQEGEQAVANGEEQMMAAEGAEGEAGAQAGGVSGLAHGLMAKAMMAKEGMKEKAASFQAPNLQGIGGNLMQGVTNLLPGKKEEDVPTPPEPNPPSEIGGEMVEGEEQLQE